MASKFGQDQRGSKAWPRISVQTSHHQTLVLPKEQRFWYVSSAATAAKAISGSFSPSDRPISPLTLAREVSLPGGKVEEGDADDVVTALREAKEEIGLDPSHVNVVTVLQPFVTKIGMTVVPVIGVLQDRKAFIPAPNAAEVEAIFDAPLEMFLKDENRRAEEREWKGDKYFLHFFDYEADNKKFVIWALTAGILIKTASVVYERPPEFLERRPIFWIRDVDKQTSMPPIQTT
ncbi:hypothetical protein TIFTF001_012815 [Ficus carica]|uniref:Nudix hydrolase domain-containing protein n=1 Tax=Ficus carica TaxID=3494 RepID=A0AA88A0Z0_FICCA|nr:hypothetical protein TIFTF001_012815 [Ficus carica]